MRIQLNETAETQHKMYLRIHTIFLILQTSSCFDEHYSKIVDRIHSSRLAFFPPPSHEQTLRVTVNVYVNQVSLEPDQNEARVNLVVNLNWADPRLAWALDPELGWPNEEKLHHAVIVDPKALWRPDILLVNGYVTQCNSYSSLEKLGTYQWLFFDFR